MTGAGGFVGSAICTRLLSKGNRVVGLFRDLSPQFAVEVSKEAPARSTAVFADVRDTETMFRILIDYDIEAVIHQAAQSVVSRCEQDPAFTYSVNTLGMVSLLEACRRYSRERPDGRLKKIIVATTDKVYGNGSVPYRESQPLAPMGAYSASKACADLIAQEYGTSYKLPIIVVRSSNIYGPGDREETRLIPGTIMRLLRGDPAVLYASAQRMQREFVYIDDEVDAYMTLLAKGTAPNVYNVGGSGPVWVPDVVRSLHDLIGGQVVHKESPVGEISIQYVDAGKLHALGWRQAVPFGLGLMRTIRWHRQFVS